MNLDTQLLHCVVGLAHEQIELVIWRKAHLFHPLPKPEQVIDLREQGLANLLRLRLLDVGSIHDEFSCRDAFILAT
jgi:hypothetical protein